MGTVNLLLRRMVRKGLLKMERINGRMLRYIITPKGMAEKAKLACHYLRQSYRQILTISQALEAVVAAETARHGRKPHLALYGPADEIMEILKIAAARLGLDCRVATTPAALNELPAESLLVITWTTDEAAEPPAVPSVNILEAV